MSIYNDPKNLFDFISRFFQQNPEKLPKQGKASEVFYDCIVKEEKKDVKR